MWGFWDADSGDKREESRRCEGRRRVCGKGVFMIMVEGDLRVRQEEDVIAY